MPKFFGGGSSGGGTVTSVFGRVGAVVAAFGDYATSLVTNDSSVAGATTKDALNTLKSSIAALVTGVSSVFGRTGAVVAALNDYAASLVSNDSSVPGSTVKDALNNLLNEAGGSFYQQAVVGGIAGAATTTICSVDLSSVNNVGFYAQAELDFYTTDDIHAVITNQAVASRVGGTLSLDAAVGSVIFSNIPASIAGCALVIDTSGNNMRLRATSVAGKTYRITGRIWIRPSI